MRNARVVMSVHFINSSSKTLILQQSWFVISYIIKTLFLFHKNITKYDKYSSYENVRRDYDINQY